MERLLKAGGVLVVVALLLASCEEEVTAVEDVDRPFSLYGVLSPQFDSQWVRVYPIERHLEPAPAENIDAHFVSTTLGSGEQRVWRDSLVRDLANQVAHVFWSPFQVEYGERYNLEVARSDGAVSFVEVQVPGMARLVAHDPVSAGFVEATVQVVGDVPRILNVEIDYDVRYRYVIFNTMGEPIGTGLARDTVTIDSNDLRRQTDEGWMIRINLRDAFESVQAYLEGMRVLFEEYGIRLQGMNVRLVAADEGWNPPEDVTDLEILMMPETMSNVENGFGFVGAGYRMEMRWLPGNDALRAAGFNVP